MIETIRGIAAFAFIVLNTVFWFVPIFSLGVLRPLLPKQLGVALGNVLLRALGGWIAGARWMVATLGVTRIDADFGTEAGAPALTPDDWYLVICNHRSWADILVLVVALHGRIPPLKFFTKRELIWIPLIGIALRLLQFPFVRRYSREQLQADPTLRGHDGDATRRACAGFRERPTSVLNFLEGTRFTPAKRDAQAAPYQALLKPKIGGLCIVLQSLADRFAAVVDVTIAYPDAAPGFWDFLCGRCPAVKLRVRALEPPATDQDAVREWVDQLWAEKDALLASS